MRTNEEILNRAIELESDNIKQERELFKHVAVVSAAIVGIFVFNGELAVSGCVKWGLIGFITVILISVILLFLIIRLERKRIHFFKESLQDINNIKNDFYLNATITFFGKDLLQKIQKNLQDGNFANFFGTLILNGVEVYKKGKEGDEKIKKINEKLQNKNMLVFFTFSSWICILIFVASLSCFLFEILSK